MNNYEDLEKNGYEENFFLLRIDSNDQIEQLELLGYSNVQELTFDDLKVKIVVVNEDERIFHTLQLRHSVDVERKNILNFEEFKVINDVNNTIGD